jgi:hypothetical protein
MTGGNGFSSSSFPCSVIVKMMRKHRHFAGN